MKRKRELSRLHRRILSRMFDRREETPDSLAAWLCGSVRDHGDQQWAYLQLARLMAKGYLRRVRRATYVISAKGRLQIAGKL